MRKRVRTVVPRTHSWMWRNVGSLALCWWGFWIHAGSSCPFLSFPDTLATWEATYSQGTDRTVQGKPTGIQHTGGCSVEIVAILPVFPSKVGGVSSPSPCAGYLLLLLLLQKGNYILKSPGSLESTLLFSRGFMISQIFTHQVCHFLSCPFWDICTHIYIKWPFSVLVGYFKVP